MLGDRGAVVFDADELARRAIDPGTPGHTRVVEAFGPGVVDPGGAVDRAALAATVFGDPDARRRLEAIVHPEVARLLQEAIDPYRPTNRVIVYDVPLLVENRLEGMFDAVVVIRADPQVRVARLVAKGMGEADARARIAAQATDDERARVATFVISNEGSPEELDTEVEALWEKLQARSI
jgi:dephospho-CoA kinase